MESSGSLPILRIITRKKDGVTKVKVMYADGSNYCYVF